MASRLLFSCRPLAGHFEPLVSLASEARAAGHAVAFATGEPFVGRAKDAGFEAFRAGRSEEFRAEWMPPLMGPKSLCVNPAWAHDRRMSNDGRADPPQPGYRYPTPTGAPCPRTIRVDGTVEGNGACQGCGTCLQFGGLFTTTAPMR